MIVTASLDHKTVHITHPEWKHDTVCLSRFVLIRRLEAVGCLLSANMSTSKGTAEALLLCLPSGAPSLSLRAVAANKGSNKSTAGSLLATVPLIVADTRGR